MRNREAHGDSWTKGGKTQYFEWKRKRKQKGKNTRTQTKTRAYAHMFLSCGCECIDRATAAVQTAEEREKKALTTMTIKSLKK